MAEVLGFGATQNDRRTFWKGNNMNDNVTNIIMIIMMMLIIIMVMMMMMMMIIVSLFVVITIVIHTNHTQNPWDKRYIYPH